MQPSNETEARQKVRDMIKDIKIALMVTQHQGKLHARPMAAIRFDEGDDLWFMTRIDSGKIHEINSNPEVLLAYSEPKDQHYVSISGQADISQDLAMIEKLWHEPLRVWFPKGPQDPTIALIRVKPESAEYWDSPSSAFVYAYGYIKARLTQQIPEELGENAVVAM